jgi:hypothetical protein
MLLAHACDRFRMAKRAALRRWRHTIRIITARISFMSLPDSTALLAISETQCRKFAWWI